MPSYPTSVYSATSKNAGDTIQASHINSLDDEVNSLTSGLLNGLQHRVIVSTGGLNVSTGNSTLGGNLSVAGTSTLTGAVTFSTYATQPVPSVLLTHDATQDVANGAWVGLSWNTETVDVPGMHSTASNSSRITFAQSTGIYEVGAQVYWNGFSTTGLRIVRVRLNDSSGGAGQAGRAIDGSEYGQQVSALMRIASTADYVTAMVFQNSGSTGSVGAGSTQYSPAFWAHKVSSI